MNETLENLDWDIQPDRDLWPDIHANIRFAKKPKRSFWVPISIAACMMIAVSAVVMSSLSFQRSQQTYELQASYIEFQRSQIQLMEGQHKQVRAQIAALLNDKQNTFSSVTVSEIEAVLATIDQASIELKDAIISQPMKANHAMMLARTYQKELKLLNQLKSLSGTTI